MRKSRFNVAYCPYCNHHYTEFVYATSGERFVAIKKNKLGEWSVQPFMQCDDIRQIRIKNVTVLGNETYTAEQAEDLIFSDYWDRNTFVCLFNSLTGKKKAAEGGVVNE